MNTSALESKLAAFKLLL
jgi:hypothetical protein